MAETYTIQFRRGMYADFDTSKIRPGEPVAILGNDPSVPSGKALYIAFAANDVRRLCSIEDISEMVNAGEFVGPQGPKGEKGDPGEKGADGTVAFESLTPEQKESLRGISIKSASIDTDGNLTITFSDGDSEDVGNIMGPQGIPGPKGDKGDVGPRGPKGDKGDVGPKGDNMSDEQAAQIEQNKKDVASLKEDLSTKITKFYASSQGETHLTDSDNGKIMDMMVYGKSEQKQYNGCQLIDFSKGIYIRNATGSISNDIITVTAKDSYSGIQFPISLKKVMGNKIILTTKKSSQSNSKASINIRIVVSTANRKEYIDLSKAYDVPENVTNIVAEIIVNNSDTDLDISNTVTVEGLQLQIGSEQLGWEPYTGGIPSPNPDYPQEIKSVVNPTVKVCGKNLLNATLQTTTQNGVTCTANGDGTFTLNGTATNTCLFTVINSDDLKKTFGTNENLRLTASPKGASKTGYYLQMWKNEPEIIYNDTGEGVTVKKPNAKCNVSIVIKNGTVCNNVLFKPMLTTDLTATYDDFEPYHEQTVTLPYTLNAIPVSSGGNVTIDGQQYIADYVDVERGKLVRMCKEIDFTKVIPDEVFNDLTLSKEERYKYSSLGIMKKTSTILSGDGDGYITSVRRNAPGLTTWGMDVVGIWQHGQGDKNAALSIRIPLNVDAIEYFNSVGGCKGIFISATPEEIDLTEKEAQALKALATYYPTTNIFINSEQLDGYTVFNYPISMENGWNYVKQQIGDTREYIYDMDARAQDTDLQAAEAYVNSEYAVALTELEV